MSNSQQAVFLGRLIRVQTLQAIQHGEVNVDDVLDMADKAWAAIVEHGINE